MNKLTIMAVLASTILFAGMLELLPDVSAAHKPVKILIQVRDAATGKPLRGVECSTDPAGGPLAAITNPGGIAKILLPAGTSIVDVTCNSTTVDDVRLKAHGTTVVRVLV
jgi:hypothetical protein